MKTRTILQLLVPLLTLGSIAHGAAFSLGNLAVSRVGDGTNALSNSVGPLSILEYTSTGFLQQAIAISTSTAGLQISGTGTSEGALSLCNGLLTIAGYIPPFAGTGSLSSRTDTNAPRGYTSVDIASGTVATPTAVSAFSGNNIRGAVTTSTGAYLAGGISGTIYRSGTTNTTIQSANGNTRVINIQNGNLYYSTGSATQGPQGIYGFSGTPTTATAATPIITGVIGQGTNPYDYAFSPDGSLLYVADGTLGIQKFILSNVVWSLAYNITTPSAGLTGLAVDFSGTNPVIFAVNPTDLYSFTDLGVTGAAKSIATAGTNYAFRGLEVVPEPTTSALLVLGVATVLYLRRHKTQTPI